MVSSTHGRQVLQSCRLQFPLRPALSLGPARNEDYKTILQSWDSFCTSIEYNRFISISTTQA